MPSSQTGWPDGTQAGAGGGGGSATEVRQNGVPVVAEPTSINFIKGLRATNPAGNDVDIAPPKLSVEENTGNISLVVSDFSGTIVKKCNSASAITVTVPAGLTPDNECSLIRHGAGSVTVVAASGVTILSADGNLALRAQYSSASLVPTGTADEYYLVGDLA